MNINLTAVKNKTRLTVSFNDHSNEYSSLVETYTDDKNTPSIRYNVKDGINFSSGSYTEEFKVNLDAVKTISELITRYPENQIVKWSKQYFSNEGWKITSEWIN